MFDPFVVHCELVIPSDEEEQARLDYERKQVEDKERKELNRLLGYKSLNSSNQKRLEELMGKYHNG